MAHLQCNGTKHAGVCGDNKKCTCDKGFIKLQEEEECLPGKYLQKIEDVFPKKCLQLLLYSVKSVDYLKKIVLNNFIKQSNTTLSISSFARHKPMDLILVIEYISYFFFVFSNKKFVCMMKLCIYSKGNKLWNYGTKMKGDKYTISVNILGERFQRKLIIIKISTQHINV